MTDFKLILSQINQTLSSLPDWNNLEDFVGEFYDIWLKLGLEVQQHLVQSQIDRIEAQYPSARTKWEKRYYTPLGEISVKRRVYQTSDGLKAKVDEELGLPKDKWLPMVLELACALGVSSEFPNSHQLFQRWTGIELTEKTVVIGDGAHWIWEMAQKQFPGSVEILDFFHLSEYVWAVAKAAYPQKEQEQKDWVKTQQTFLKKSQWQTVLKNCHQFPRKNQELIESMTNLERYLSNNQSRIDYQNYLKAGLMIGSGVVESSNRRVVTQRLKQAGMHWSVFGAEGVMALRAAYLSNSNRWSSFWSEKNTIKSKLAYYLQ